MATHICFISLKSHLNLELKMELNIGDLWSLQMILFTCLSWPPRYTYAMAGMGLLPAGVRMWGGWCVLLVQTAFLVIQFTSLNWKKTRCVVLATCLQAIVHQCALGPSIMFLFVCMLLKPETRFRDKRFSALL